MQRLVLSKPPVVEFVLGVQFSPAIGLTAAHYGLFWEQLGRSEWKSTSDEMPLEDQMETFDIPRWQVGRPQGLRFSLAAPLGRVNFIHSSGAKLIQLQPTRLLLNWSKTADFKPSYSELFQEFNSTVHAFDEFVSKEKIGKLALNQWELTYVDMFPHGEDWSTPAQWSKILPGLFSDLFGTSDIDMELDHRGAEWSFEILPKLARLHISARPGRWRDERHALMMTMTARGPLSSIDAMQRCFDLGHEKSIAVFQRIVSPALLEKWK